MRSRTVFVALALLVSTAAFAQSSLRFDPPDPTSRTPVLAKIHLASTTCAFDTASVTRAAQLISIVATRTTVCTPAGATPASADLDVDLGVVPAGVYHVSVSPGATLLALAEATLVVRDAAPAFVVEPNALLYPKGTIRLTAPGIEECASGVMSTTCLPFNVLIGDTPAVVLSHMRDAIVIAVPPTLARGVYDVTVKDVLRELRATAALEIGDVATEAFNERVLFPVFFAGPGAFGAQWKTDASLYNGNVFSWIMGTGTLFTSYCTPECDSSPLPGTTAFASGGPAAAGIVERIPRQAAPRAAFGLHVRDLSRAAQDAGTEIPVVRERDLYDLPFQLLDVPTDPRDRLMLRLYDLDGAHTFLVRVYAMSPFATDGSITLLTERLVPLTSARSLGNGGFAILNDPLAGVSVPSDATLRLEIVPLDDSGRHRNVHGLASAWGFLTVTNDQTQHVTVISPQ
jgi:hypothetical protein